MLKRQSVSEIYNLIQLYTVKLRNIQNNMQNSYKYAQMNQIMLKYAKRQNIICKFLRFYKTTIGLKGCRFK